VRRGRAVAEPQCLDHDEHADRDHRAHADRDDNHLEERVGELAALLVAHCSPSFLSMTCR
jgi:hypothetical protein